MSLRGKQIHDIIARRKEREKLVEIETRTGEGPPPLLAMAAAEGTLTSEFTIEELDAEIAKSRERREKRKKLGLRQIIFTLRTISLDKPKPF